MKEANKKIRSSLGGNKISTILERSINSFELCSYLITGKIGLKQEKDGLRSIDKCDLIAKDKFWWVLLARFPE